MKLKAELLDEKSVHRTLTRISHEIVEKNKGVDNVILIGIERRGFPLAQRIGKIIESIEGVAVPAYSLDITFFRDDIEENHNDPIVKSKLSIDVKDKVIILVDDVLYTGRTTRAAIDAVIHAGRPKMIQLAVMADRGHRELPIRADFIGKNIPTSKNEIVSVEIMEIDGKDSVKIYEL